MRTEIPLIGPNSNRRFKLVLVYEDDELDGLLEPAINCASGRGQEQLSEIGDKFCAGVFINGFKLIIVTLRTSIGTCESKVWN